MSGGSRQLARAREAGEAMAAAELAAQGAYSPLAGPLGQRVMDWAPAAQRGLDGLFYEPQNTSQEREGAALAERSESISRSLTRFHGASDASAFDSRDSQLELFDPDLTPSVLRFARQQAIWDLLAPHRKADGSFDYETGERIAKCRKVKVPFGKAGTTGEVWICVSETGGVDHEGLSKCKAKLCPVCGFPKAREQLLELSACVWAWLEGKDERDAGAALWRDLWMVTLAPPHLVVQSQRDRIDKLTDARNRFWKMRGVREWLTRWGIDVRVTAFDRTFGESGLHAHNHIALAVENAVLGPADAGRMGRPIGEHSLGIERTRMQRKGRPRGLDKEDRKRLFESLKADLMPYWERACEAAKVPGMGKIVDGKPDKQRLAFRTYSLDVSGADKATEYLLKWGLAEEVGLAAAKMRNEWWLLDEYAAGDASEFPGGAHAAGAQFVEFYHATKREKFLTGIPKFREVAGVDAAFLEEHAQRLRDKREERGELRALGPRVRVPVADLESAVYAGWHRVADVALRARTAAVVTAGLVAMAGVQTAPVEALAERWVRVAVDRFLAGVLQIRLTKRENRQARISQMAELPVNGPPGLDSG